jgi:DNA-binding SARP family transcriptional activator
MWEFRILGPLEVVRDGQPVPLGGQRQRAVLAVLLVHHGQVVPTERIIDLLWGEHPPRTAATSLQNAVSQLRRELAPDVIETQPPGYALGVGRDAIDAVRFESMVASARRAPPEERAELLRAALGLWRGPPLADLASEEFAQGEIRRLEELRLTALEGRIAADIDLGHHSEVIGELEGLAAAHPHRERVCALRMLALYRSGRQAEALRAFHDTRRVLVDALGIEPGAELQELNSRILRQEAGLGAGALTGVTTDVEAEVARALLSGRVVPVLGLPNRDEVAKRLATAFEVPSGAPADLARVSQYVASMQGAGPLHDELHAIYGRAQDDASVPRFLAGLPPLLRARGSPLPLIVTTAYDGDVERAFAEAGEELDVVTYTAAGPLKGRFVHRPAGEEPRVVELPNAYVDISLEHRAVLLRLRGAVDPTPERAWESFVITEDDHIDYPGSSELEGAIPVTLAASLRRSHFLFLGYDLADWNLRLVVSRLRGERPGSYASWAVRSGPTPLELAFWRHWDVQAIDLDQDAFVGLLQARLDGAGAP